MAHNPHAEIDSILGPEFRSPHEQDDTEVDLLEATHDGLKGTGFVPPMHNSRVTRDGAIQKENPRHRGAAYMIATGLTQTKVAELTGYSRAHINTLCQQQWFKDEVAYFIHQEGGDPLKDLFRAAAVEGFWTLQHLLEDSKTPANVREKIANTAIDRVYGKPPAVIKTEDVTKSEDPKQDANTLLAQLEKIEAAKRAALDRQKKQQTTQNNVPDSSQPSPLDLSGAE